MLFVICGFDRQRQDVKLHVLGALYLVEGANTVYAMRWDDYEAIIQFSHSLLMIEQPLIGDERFAQSRGGSRSESVAQKKQNYKLL
jgi:hypothetical protein